MMLIASLTGISAAVIAGIIAAGGSALVITLMVLSGGALGAAAILTYLATSGGRYALAIL